ncbi:hypothetical protein [Streptomyces sp. CC210A]
MTDAPAVGPEAEAGEVPAERRTLRRRRRTRAGGAAESTPR